MRKHLKQADPLRATVSRVEKPRRARRDSHSLPSWYLQVIAFSSKRNREVKPWDFDEDISELEDNREQERDNANQLNEEEEKEDEEEEEEVESERSWYLRARAFLSELEDDREQERDDANQLNEEEEEEDESALACGGMCAWCTFRVALGLLILVQSGTGRGVGPLPSGEWGGKGTRSETVAGDPDMSVMRWVHDMGRQHAGPKDNGGRAVEVLRWSNFDHLSGSANRLHGQGELRLSDSVQFH